jgi:protocatechuate 3,4-dioxygenase beta subunit
VTSTRTHGSAYTGHFTIVWPQIHGRVTDTNNQPVAGVLVEASNGLTSALTDTNGEYAVKLLWA